MQNYVFEESAKKEISDSDTDQRFRIIEIKKSVEAHNTIMPYLSKTKESVTSTSVFSESKDSESKFSNNSGKSTALKAKYSTKGSDLSGISSISSDLSNDRTSYLNVVERRKTVEEAKLIALQAKEPAKRKIEFLEKIFEIEKMHLRNEEIEAQNLAELAESAISLEEKVDLSQIQNAANTKTHSPSLSNEDIHTLKSPKISSPINHKTKNTHSQDNEISNDSDEIKNKTTVFQERFSQNNQTNYNPTEVRRPPIDGFIDQLIEGKESVLDTSSASFIVQDILKQELESRHLLPIDLLRFSGSPAEWPELIENFFSPVHQKSSFDNNLRMLKLISVLDVEAKRVISAIGSNGIFYTTALKT